MNNKKVLIICAVILAFAPVFAYLYTMPSQWLTYDKEVSLLNVINFENNKEVTLDGKDSINEIVALITDTKTHKRVLFSDEEGYADADSGYLITVRYSDGSFCELKYSFLKGGLVYAKGNMLCVGKNERLIELLSHITE